MNAYTDRRNGLQNLWIHRGWGLALVLLLCLFGQALLHAHSASLTVDEGAHLLAGYAFLYTGDLVIQRHRFEGVDGPPLTLRTGAYWLDTMERWTVAGTDDDMLLIPLDLPKRQ